jgi:hypothetical protein
MPLFFSISLLHFEHFESAVSTEAWEQHPLRSSLPSVEDAEQVVDDDKVYSEKPLLSLDPLKKYIKEENNKQNI